MDDSIYPDPYRWLHVKGRDLAFASLGPAPVPGRPAVCAIYARLILAAILSTMTTTSPLFHRAIASFDAVNALDPRIEIVDGRPEPKELVYARRMSDTLSAFLPDAPETLRLAVRAQHIARWQIPRTDFPEGKKGYKQWRSKLMGVHAEIADGILAEVGYDQSTRERVARLIRKEGVKRDPEVQALEDTACLVFLRHYFDEFIAEHDDAKLLGIIRKTWEKMSESGHAAALKIAFRGRGAELILRALEG